MQKHIGVLYAKLHRSQVFVPPERTREAGSKFLDISFRYVRRPWTTPTYEVTIGIECHTLLAVNATVVDVKSRQLVGRNLKSA